MESQNWNMLVILLLSKFALRLSKRLPSLLSCLIPGLGFNCNPLECWLDLRVVLNMSKKDKISWHCREKIPHCLCHILFKRYVKWGNPRNENIPTEFSKIIKQLWNQSLLLYSVQVQWDCFRLSGMSASLGLKSRKFFTKSRSAVFRTSDVTDKRTAWRHCT